jgi:hypothetical protein
MKWLSLNEDALQQWRAGTYYSECHYVDLVMEAVVIRCPDGYYISPRVMYDSQDLDVGPFDSLDAAKEAFETAHRLNSLSDLFTNKQHGTAK